MGDELFGRSRNQDEEMAIQEAASAGLKSMDDFIRAVSKKNQQMDCREITDSTVSKFRTVISMLNRTGHARFRRATVQPELTQASSPPQTLELFSGSLEPAAKIGGFVMDTGEVMGKEWFSLSTSCNSSSTLLSSITGEGSVSNGKGGGGSVPATLLDSSTLAVRVGELPVPGKRCREHKHNHSGKTSGPSFCHCKKKKSRAKTTIRVPAVSSKIADIPADEYSWRKYGQKPIKNSPYPRGYYRCSTARGCPAKKHVERANDDPKMLLVTYSGEHLHAAQEKTVTSQAYLTVVESSAT